MNVKRFFDWKTLSLVTCALAWSVGVRAQSPPSADPPKVVILAPDPTALEGVSSGAFTLARSGATTADLTVFLSISGTASNGVDYALITNVMTIPVGAQAVDIPVQPITDLVNRGNKTVVLTLGTNAAYQVGDDRRATVTIIDDTLDSQPPTVTLISPTNGSVFAGPAVILLQADASDADAPIRSVSFYANDDFLGRSTNTQSPYSLVWSNAHAGRYALFARAEDQLGLSTLSAPVNITVSNAPPNAPPVVTLLSPTNGEVFTQPANVNIQANVTDSDDAVVKVEFIGDEHFQQVLTNGPYSVTWSNVPPGRHTVWVRATDASGLSAWAGARFTVSNAPPVVTLLGPTNGMNFVAHQDIPLQAQATDADDAVQKVSFWAGEHFLGVVTNSPYTVVWHNVPRGVYWVRAVATDQYGVQGVSSPALINISAGPDAHDGPDE